MFWRMLSVILVLVVAAYFFGQRSHKAAEPMAQTDTATHTAAAETDIDAGSEIQPEDVSFAPVSMPATAQAPVVDPAPAASTQEVAAERYTLDIEQESQRIASAAGVSIGTILVTDRLPAQSPMAMIFRRGTCILLISKALPLDGLKLENLTLYGQRQLTYTLGHETGHCYVRTHVAQRDPQILPSLSPPGKGYSFEQYSEMMGNYSEYPDLNRWSEEWADTFAAFILSRVYGKDFAMSVTSERFSLRKNQERNGSVLISNVYGGHGSLSDENLFNIQSPYEIANIVKRGRLISTQ